MVPLCCHATNVMLISDEGTDEASEMSFEVEEDLPPVARERGLMGRGCSSDGFLDRYRTYVTYIEIR